MARYNKIFAGPVSENLPQVRELFAAAAITPGQILTLSSGKFTPAGASTVGPLWIAQENYLAMETPDNNYAIDDTVIGLVPMDEMLFAVLVPTGVNVALGAELSRGAAGAVVLSTTGRPVDFHAVEAYNNTSGAAQLVRVRPASGGGNKA
jgi:hypothetical protein